MKIFFLIYHKKKILKGKKKNPTFQTQIKEKKIYRNNINEETQTMKSFQGNKFNNLLFFPYY